jgi:superfamily II DNA or RNA helicase
LGGPHGADRLTGVILKMNELIQTIHRALSQLDGNDPDGAREINHVGFSKFDGGFGRSLLNAYPHWTPKQAEAAHKMAWKYRRQCPYVPEYVAGKTLEVVTALEESAPTCTEPEWGIRWSSPRTVNTSQGLRIVRSGDPTPSFSADWRKNKEAIKAQGYSLKTYQGRWMVAHWSIPTQAPAPEPEKVAIPMFDHPFDPTGLLDYQKTPSRSLADIVRRHGSGLDASDTGTGKTYMTLAAFRHLGISPVVVCPKAVKSDWIAVAKHIGIRIEVVNYELLRAGNTPHGRWESKSFGPKVIDVFVWAPNVKGVIFDEVHRCAAPKTQNTLMLIAARLQRIPTIMASATVGDNPLHLRGIGYHLNLHNLRDYWDWIASHGCHQNRWNGWEFGGRPDDIERLHRSIFPDHGVRVRVADLGDQFPTTQIIARAIEVESPDSISAAHADMVERFRAIEERSKSDRSGAEHLTAMLRARQVSELQKVPGIIELTKDLLAEGKKVVIGVNFNDTVGALMKAFPDAVKVVGGQSQSERDAAKAAFQSGAASVIILNMQAGGVGIGLHGRDRVSICSPPWSARVLKQFWGRVWRAKGDHSIQYTLFAAGTPEMNVAKVLEARLGRMRTLNDGIDSIDAIAITDADLCGLPVSTSALLEEIHAKAVAA